MDKFIRLYRCPFLVAVGVSSLVWIALSTGALIIIMKQNDSSVDPVPSATGPYPRRIEVEVNRKWMATRGGPCVQPYSPFLCTLDGR